MKLLSVLLTLLGQCRRSPAWPQGFPAELEHALKYAAQKEGGQVYQMQVPTHQLNQWIDDFQVQPLRDSLKGTAGSGLEYRFSPSVAPALNKYLVPPP